jgi:hypothetical protein
MLGVIVLAFLIFFAWLILQRRFLLGGDCFSYSYPLRSIAWSNIRHGELPLWTPDVLSGYPLLSMTQLGLGYPLTWSYLFLPGYIAEQLYVFAPFLLAPMFTYAYARSLGRSPLASLLAGLSFGYGGAMTGLLGVIGLVGNSFMWLPLVLIAIDRSRTKKFLSCLLGATAAFAMSVLNGYTQAFVFVALISFGYAAWISFFLPQPATSKLIERLRPLWLVLCSTLLAVGIAAIQIFETWQAAQLSIRKSLTYLTFTDGSFSPAVLLKSVVAPLYMNRFADVTAFVTPIVFGLALFAVVDAWPRPRSDDVVRIKFWWIVTLVAGSLVLGSYMPTARIVFYVPVLNKFRVPSRHVLELTFSLSILAAFGWDSIKLRWAHLQSRRRLSILALALLLLTVATGYFWLRATTATQTMAGVEAVGSWYAGLSMTTYLVWKFVWLALGLVCGVIAWHISHKNLQTFVLTCLIVASCLTEPYICFRNWWSNLAKTPARIQTPAPVTRALQAEDGNRVYTRFDLFIDDIADVPRADSQNLPALHGLHNVAGSEPLVLERYSRALGNVGPDSVNETAGNPPSDSIFNDNSHVLDILNTTAVATFTDLRSTPKPLPVFEGVKLALNETVVELPPGSTKLIGLPDFNADTIVLVTSLANSVDVEEGAIVGRLRLLTDSGTVIEQELRAGIDTAEWAHERSDVHPIIKHHQARVFDRPVGDTDDTYQACRYIARVQFDSAHIRQVELVNVTPKASIAVWAASLLDNATGQSQTLSRLMLTVRNNPQRWRIESLPNDLMVLHNSRALPRAWLVTTVEAVDSEEALRRIRGESTHQFDPRSTALLEVAQHDLPNLPGGPLVGGGANITDYHSNRLRIETSASTPTVLVLSEIFYPAGRTKIDGGPATIMVTDYLLRGVALPAGNHVVEMRYAAPEAGKGAIISIISLVICAILMIRVLLLRGRLLGSNVGRGRIN